MRNKFLLFIGVIQFFFGSYGMESNDINVVRTNLQRYIAENARAISPADSVMMINFIVDTVGSMVSPIPTISTLHLLLSSTMRQMTSYPSFNAGGFKLEFRPRMDIEYDWGPAMGNCSFSLLSLRTAIAKTPDPTKLMAQLRTDTKAFFAGKEIPRPPIDDIGFFAWARDMRIVDLRNEEVFRTALLEREDIRDISKFPFTPPFVREVFNFNAGQLAKSSRHFLRGFLNANLFVPRTDNIEEPSSVSVAPSGFLGVNILDNMERDLLGTIELLPLYQQLLAQLITNVQAGMPEKGGVRSRKTSDLYNVVNPSLSVAERRSFYQLMNLKKDLWENILDPDIRPEKLFEKIYLMCSSTSAVELTSGLRSIREYLQTHPVDPDNTVKFILSVDKLFKRSEVVQKVAQARERTAAKAAEARRIQELLARAVVTPEDFIVMPPPVVAESADVQASEAPSSAQPFIQFSRRLNVLGDVFKQECFVVDNYRDGGSDALLQNIRLQREPRVKRWEQAGDVKGIFEKDPEYASVPDPLAQASTVLRHNICPQILKYVGTHGQLRIDAAGKRRVLIPGIMRITRLSEPGVPMQSESGVFEVAYDENGKIFHLFFNIKTPQALREILEQADDTVVGAGSSASSVSPDPDRKGKKPMQQ